MTHFEKILDFPKVLATLKVWPSKRYIFWGPPKWTLELSIVGPDARYNAGRDRLGVLRVRGLAVTLKGALAELDSPTGLNVGAVYRRPFGLGGAVEKENGRAWVTFELSSTTRILSRSLSAEEVRRAINVLESIPDEAKRIAGAV